MPRAFKTHEQALLEGAAYQVHTQLWVEDPDGVFVDVTALDGRNWLLGFEHAATIDQPVGSIRAELWREDADGSLAPFMGGSPINRDAADAYARFLNVGREFYYRNAISAIGATPASGDWWEVVRGQIDELPHEGRQSRITLVGRDLGGILLDTKTESEQTYGVNGQLMETALQLFLDEWAPGVTLYVPVSPGKTIPALTVAKDRSVLEVLREVALGIAHDVRYLWDAGTASFRLTFYLPARDKVTPDLTLTPALYTDVRAFAIARRHVRNAFAVTFRNASTGDRETLTYDGSDSTALQDSEDEYGRLWMGFDEADDSPVDSTSEAQSFMEAAASDVSQPLADQEVEMLYFPHVELGDLIEFEPNGVHYDSAQNFAVVGYRHRLYPKERRTWISTRGKPAGAHMEWLRRGATPYEAPGEAGDLEDGSVTTPKIADDAVTTPKIDDGAVTTPKLGDQAVLAAKLADDAVERAKILDGAVNDLKLANLAVTNAKLALAAVDTANVVDGAMTEVKVASGAITTTKIADDAISTPKLQALAITAGKLAAGAVVAGKLSAGAIDASSIIANGIITNALIATGTITGDRLVANTITAGQIAALTITAAEISAGAVTAAKISVSDLAAITANLGTITTGQLNSPDGNAYIRMQASQGWFIYAESGGVPTVQIGHNGSVTLTGDLILDTTLGNNIAFRSSGSVYAELSAFDAGANVGGLHYTFSGDASATFEVYRQIAERGVVVNGELNVSGDNPLTMGGDWYMLRHSNGNFDLGRNDVPYFYFDTAGDAHCLLAGGSWNDYSDVRLKRNVAEIPGNLARAAVRAVPAIRYRRTTANAPWEVGFSAQALGAVLPEAVREGARTVDGVPNAMSIAYGRITPVLWNAVRDIDQDLVLLRQAIRSATDLAHLKELIGV